MHTILSHSGVMYPITHVKSEVEKVQSEGLEYSLIKEYYKNHENREDCYKILAKEGDYLADFLPKLCM